MHDTVKGHAPDTTTLVQFSLNGQPFTALAEKGWSLMDVLREKAGICSVKNGCAPQGSCGCCAVIVDDKTVSSCVVPAEKVAGKNVLTLGGFSEREREIFSKAFVLSAGLQCGFCIPGIITR